MCIRDRHYTIGQCTDTTHCDEDRKHAHVTLQRRPKKKAAATGFSHRELPDAAAKQSGFEGNQCKKVCHAALNVEPTRLNLVKGEVQVIGEGSTAAE